MNQNVKHGFLFLIISALIFWITKDFILFWDTIQFAGHHPLFYFENDFSFFFLPENMDSGHIPTFGIYIAAVWKLLGRSLWASHLAMLPFVFLCLWYAFRIGQEWIADARGLLFPLLLVCMPQSLSQLMLVSPDVALLAFFLGLILFIEKENKLGIFIHSIGLVLISSRGFILLLTVVIWLFLSQRNQTNLRRSILAFLPALSIFLTYQFIHYIHSGWMGIHEEMPWSESFGLVSFSSLFRNAIICLWRLMDYGAVIIWVFLLYIIWKDRITSLGNRHLPLLIILLIIFGITTIPFEGLMQHRYFLPILVLAGFKMLKNVFASSLSKRIKWIITGTTCTFLILGNFWIYPDKIAQGWDSTLAHLPYYELQEEISIYLDAENIEKSKVATAFPLRTSQHILSANENYSQYQNKDNSDTEFILYSNVMNDFSDQEIETFSADYELIKSWQRRGVKMILYRRLESN